MSWTEMQNNRNRIGLEVERILKMPRDQWEFEKEKVSIEPAFPGLSDVTLRQKVKDVFELMESMEGVGFRLK